MPSVTVYLSGEGVTDFGSASKNGPFYYLVKMLMEHLSPHLSVDYSIIERTSLHHMHKMEPKRAGFRMPRAKEKDSSLQVLRILAEMLGKHANEKGADFSILQEDVDLTRKELPKDSKLSVKAKQERAAAIREAMKNGFRIAQAKGVPMVTCPRSEAWLLWLVEDCRLSAAKLEDLPCNDKAPDDGKTLMVKYGYKNADDRADLVINRFDPNIGLPLYAYNLFTKDLEETVRSID